MATAPRAMVNEWLAQATREDMLAMIEYMRRSSLESDLLAYQHVQRHPAKVQNPCAELHQWRSGDVRYHGSLKRGDSDDCTRCGMLVHRGLDGKLRYESPEPEQAASGE